MFANLLIKSFAGKLDSMPEHTSHQSRNIIIGLIIFVALIGAGGYWYSDNNANSPPNNSADDKVEFVIEEKIENWQFKGVYSGNSELEKKAHAGIERLNGMFGTEGNTDYILYVSIAGQYELLGDGAKEYEYLLRALAEDSKTTGLAWYNLGTLLVRLGAFESARIAYSRAVAAQPSFDQYQTRYLEFLTQQFPKDDTAIEKAFADASVASDGSSTVLQIRARWLEGAGRIQEAMAEWRKIRDLSPASAPAVNIELRRLKGEL